VELKRSLLPTSYTGRRSPIKRKSYPRRRNWWHLAGPDLRRVRPESSSQSHFLSLSPTPSTPPLPHSDHLHQSPDPSPNQAVSPTGGGSPDFTATPTPPPHLNHHNPERTPQSQPAAEPQLPHPLRPLESVQTATVEELSSPSAEKSADRRSSRSVGERSFLGPAALEPRLHKSRAPSPPLAQVTLPRPLGVSLWTPNSQRYFPSRTWSSGRPGDRMAPKSSAHSELTPLNPRIARAGSRWVPVTAGF